MASERRIGLEGGVYAVALYHEDGNIEITEYELANDAGSRTYGRVGVCPRCGSHDVHAEKRDGPPSGSRAYGTGSVCNACGQESPWLHV